MTTIAVLGTGIMGLPMARSLLAAGHEIRAWNRSADKARPLADEGAILTATPAEAVGGAAVVLTMLADGDAVEQVMRAAGPATANDALWLQMSTVGVAWADRLEDDARLFEVGYVDAPVLGSATAAEQGELVILASGPEEVQALCAPVFDAVGKRTLWIGEAGAGSRLKVVAGGWVSALAGVLAESITLAEALDVDPRLFLDAIDGTPVGAPYAQLKGPAMIAHEYPAAFPLRHASKDTRLLVEAARHEGLRLAIAEAVAKRFADADHAGHGDSDISAVRRTIEADSTRRHRIVSPDAPRRRRVRGR